MGWQVILGDRLTVGQHPLKVFIGVRIPVPQLCKIMPPLKGGIILVQIKGTRPLLDTF